MDSGYTEQIVYASTADGLGLEGVLIVPVALVRPPVLWIHGSSTRFSGRVYVEIGRELVVFVTRSSCRMLRIRARAANVKCRGR